MVEIKLPRCMEFGCYGMKGSWMREADEPTVDEVLSRCIEKCLKKTYRNKRIHVDVKTGHIEGAEPVLSGEVSIRVYGDTDKDWDEYGGALSAGISIDGNTVHISDVYVELLEKCIWRNNKLVKCMEIPENKDEKTVLLS